jgi:hypothetical protein
MKDRVGRNDSCPCGSGKKYKRCCLGATARERPLTSRHEPSRAEVDGDGLTLLVETAQGTMVRSIPGASPLRADARQGYAAEEATHNAAALWGMPDFTFRPKTTSVGSGRRELGDGVIVVGDLAVVVQVKSRGVLTSDPDKERRWLDKKATEGLRQANGTVRRLCVRPERLTNVRETTLEIDGNSRRWLSVVVLDHPQPPEGFTPALTVAKHPAVVVLRRDWEFLFDQLKSTYAVVQYFERVAGEELALGHEPVRYYDLARADAATSPSEFPRDLLGPGVLTSAPLLPMAPAASDDLRAHKVVRAMFEDIAVTRLTTSSEEDRLRILAELDRLPVAQRVAIGRFMLEAMGKVSQHRGPGVVWQMRSARGEDGRTHLGFGACSHPYNEDIKAGFTLWTQLRHHDVASVTGDTDRLTTVAVLMTPRGDGRRPWDTSVSAVSGDLSFTESDLAELRKLWPTPATA